MQHLLLTLFLGSFQGTGVATFASGKKYACDEIFLRLEASLHLFRLREGGYDCGLLKASFDPFKMTVRDGKLFDGEKEIGKISDQEIDYQIYDEEDFSTYHLNLKLKETILSYSEEWFDRDKLALTVQGKLTRK
jgi:hypothetical protein